MRFFHLSDLHIGLRLIGQDLQEDQRYIFAQIADRAAERRPEAVVIAGDIYDRAVPSAEAVELFDFFLNRLTGALPDADIMMISGNHDSASRVDLFRNILTRQRIHMIGHPPRRQGERIQRVRLQDAFGPVNFYLLPFVRPSMAREAVGAAQEERGLSYDETLRRLIRQEQIDTRERNVLVSHQFYLPAGKDPEQIERADSEIKTVGNIDQVGADVLECFDYAALGHIHQPMRAGSDRMRYCGTPLACSVSEAGQSKGILEVELGKKGELRIDQIPLTPLRQVRRIRGELADVLREGCDDYVSVTLTDRDTAKIAEMKSRLREAFPHLLEIRREGVRTADYEARIDETKELEPLELCRRFLPQMDEREEEILRDVIHTLQEVSS